MTEKMYAPKLRFGSGELIPVGFDSLVKIKIGLTHTPKYVPSGQPFLSSKNISKGFIDFEDIKYMSEEEFNSLPGGARPNVGDILFTRVGSNLGNPIVLEDTRPFGIFVSLGAITVNKGTNNYFIKYWMDTSYFWKQVEQKVAGGAKNNLNTSWLKEFKLAIPPIEEQQKIASFLSKVDKKIELLTKKKSKLTEYKKGVIQQLFNGKFEQHMQHMQHMQDGKTTFTPPTLRFKADDGNDFPDWEENRLGDYEELIHGDGDWILAKDISENGEHRVVQLGNVGFGTYVEKKLKTITESSFKEVKGTPILDGDLLINRMIDAAKMNCCIFKKVGKYITSVDVCWIRENNKLDNYFLSNLLTTRDIQNKILSLSSGSGRVRISKKNLFEKLLLPIPSRAEQTKIADFLSAIDQKVDLANSELEKAKEWKKGLLQQMFI